jgi:hypothetical protein
MQPTMLKQKLHRGLYGVLVYIIFTGCKKEYSCEGCRSSVEIKDSVATASPKPWTCSACMGMDNYMEGKWNFYNDNSFYCGDIDTAIAMPNRVAFTFFGPSSCSGDSGMVITIIIEPLALTKNIYNHITNDVGFYYYDNTGRTHPFISRRGEPFSVSIDSYIQQTKIMTGRFGGTVYKPNGDATSITGKFVMKIP